MRSSVKFATLNDRVILPFCFTKFQENKTLSKFTVHNHPSLAHKVSGPEVIKLFMVNSYEHDFQLLIETKILAEKKFLALSLSAVVFIMLINVKMPTIVGILTFMSMINFMLS